jgi:hypothetical protein
VAAVGQRSAGLADSAPSGPSSAGMGIAPMGTKRVSVLSRTGGDEALEIASKRSMKISASIVATHVPQTYIFVEDRRPEVHR